MCPFYYFPSTNHRSSSLNRYADGVWTKAPVPEPEPLPEPSLEELKANKIALSKTLLAKFLEDNPLKSSCHEGKEAYYNITQEKQNLLANSFSAHIIFVQKGIPDTMTWNDTGNVCEEWTDAECMQLLKEMKDCITLLVSKQQHIEIEIKACETAEEMEAIEINYETVA